MLNFLNGRKSHLPVRAKEFRVLLIAVVVAMSQPVFANDSVMTLYVTRASDRDYQRVNRVTVDRRTLSVLSRTDTPLGCDRVHAAPDGSVLCFTRVIPNQPKHYSAPTVGNL